MTSLRHNGVLPTSTTSRDDAYLDAAREVILAVGWSRTTLTDVARRAGVSRMTLYRRWPDMQTLLGDLMTREWATVVTAATELREEGTDARTRLVLGLTATVRALRTNPLLRRIVELDPDRLLPYLLQRRGRSQEALARLLADLIGPGQADGSIRAGDPDLLARSLLLAAHGFTLSAHTMLDAEPAADRPDPAGPDGQPDLAAYDDQLTTLVDRYLAP